MRSWGRPGHIKVQVEAEITPSQCFRRAFGGKGGRFHFYHVHEKLAAEIKCLNVKFNQKWKLAAKASGYRQ